MYKMEGGNDSSDSLWLTIIEEIDMIDTIDTIDMVDLIDYDCG